MFTCKNKQKQKRMTMTVKSWGGRRPHSCPHSYPRFPRPYYVRYYESHIMFGFSHRTVVDA